MADELTSTKTYDPTAETPNAGVDKDETPVAAGTHPESGDSDPSREAGAEQAPSRTEEELAKFREASGISFISHAWEDIRDHIKAPDGIPGNLRVGREGEVPEVRADLFTADGPRSEMQVDVHVHPDDIPTKDVGFGQEAAAASQKAQLRPEVAAPDAPDDGHDMTEEEAALQVKSGDDVLSSAKERKDTSEFEGNLDPDAPVTGVVDEDGNVTATNAAPEAGQLVTGTSIEPDGSQADNTVSAGDGKPDPNSHVAGL